MSHPHSLRPVSGLLFLAALFSGCSSFHSTAVDPQHPEKHNRIGLWYKLPKALLTIQGGPSKTDPTGYEITVVPEIVADSRRDYHLAWIKQPLYDDKTAKPITLNAKGLLTNVELNTTDQTPGIITDLVDTTVSVFKIAGGGAQSADLRAALAAMPPFSYTLDPFDANERERVLARLREHGVDVQICPPASGSMSCVGPSLAGGGKTVAQADLAQIEVLQRDGVLFHPPTAVELRFEVARLNLITRKTVTVPNPDIVAHFPFRRAPLVASTTVLTLVDGMPSGFTIDRPSPVKAFTGLLKTVTSTVASAVPTLVNVNVNREKSELAAEKGLLDAQTAHLKAQQQLLKEQAALAGMQSAPAPPSNLSDKASTKTAAEGAGPAGGPQSGEVDQATGASKQLKFQGTVDLPQN
jgi:hypothetical protein